jgi:hypothetical protein
MRTGEVVNLGGLGNISLKTDPSLGNLTIPDIGGIPAPRVPFPHFLVSGGRIDEYFASAKS